MSGSRGWLRLLLGLALFSAVAGWVIQEGSYLQHLSVTALIASTFVSFVIALLQALTLCVVAQVNGRQLSYRQALRITALGSLGNAAGGLPLGTAAKFAILYKQVGLTLGQITFGLATFAAGISLSLLAYTAVSAAWLDLEPWVKEVPAVLLAGAALGGLASLLILPKRGRFLTLAVPYTRSPYPLMVGGLSLLIASSFVLNSCAVGWLLRPDTPLPELIFISASGILIGLLTLLQSIAGVHELAMALMAYVVGARPVDGAHIALTLRVTALASSALILLVHHLAYAIRAKASD